MLDLAEELHRWAEEGREFAVATVVAVGGSAPRGPGAALAVAPGHRAPSPARRRHHPHSLRA
ncbi:XdhC family protein, partial [Streptomyces sp. NPDC049099]|uniref:XdhC family protein n=1 Tax=Streptomyces sp. NPDC049099 TaxID=3155768 RepID=UPI003431476D